jgi:hypothetical protein
MPGIAGSTGVDFSSIDSLCDILDIININSVINDEETQIDLELDLLLQNKLKMEQMLQKLDSTHPILRSSQSEAKSLSNIIGKTWRIAQGMSEKVRRLDLEQSR